MTEETKADEIVQETAPETSKELEDTTEDIEPAEKVQFSDEQKAKN